MFKKMFVLLISTILLLTSFSIQPALAAPPETGPASSAQTWKSTIITKTCEDVFHRIQIVANVSVDVDTVPTTTYPYFKVIAYKIKDAQASIRHINVPSFPYRTTLQNQWLNKVITSNQQSIVIQGGGNIVEELWIPPLGYTEIFVGAASCRIQYP